MDSGGEKKHVEVGHMETIAKMHRVAAKDNMEGAADRNFDAAAVSHGDVAIVGVGNVVLEEFLNRAHITGSITVDTCMCSRGLECGT
jgi:hypothetical protein